MTLQKYRPNRWTVYASAILCGTLTIGISWYTFAGKPNAQPEPHEEIAVGLPPESAGQLLAVLKVPSIQRELELNDEQMVKLDELDKKAGTVRGDEAFHAIQEVLLPPQFKRYRQIVLRGLMVRAFAVREVAEGLGLSPEQKEKIAAIRTNLKTQLQPFQMQIIRDGSPKNYSEAMDLYRDTAAFHENAYKMALEVLTDEQRKAWEEMAGPPPVRNPGGG